MSQPTDASEIDLTMATLTSGLLLRPIPGKGLGFVTTKPIPAGTIIIQDPAIMRIPIPAQKISEEILADAYSVLSRRQQTTIGTLSANHRSGSGSQLMRIFTSNCHGNGSACWLHPTIDRVNHACVPNATTATDECCIGEACQVIAEREIEAGEEVTISYNSELYEIATAGQRKGLLGKQYGFECDCEVCVERERRELSDMRRRLVRALRERLYLQTSGLDQENVAKADVWTKRVERKVSATERTVFYSLLAGLEEAEGLSALSVAQSYWRAAEAMLEQTQALQSIVVLAWAEHVRDWMKKAISTMDAVRSPFDHDPQKLRVAWESMQKVPCMRVALGFMDGSLEVHVKGWNRSSAFAIQNSKGQLKVLSEAECNALLNGITGSISPFSQEDTGPGGQQRRETTKAKAPKTMRSRWTDTSSLVKVVGAALTCAAPVAAYWMMK